MAHYVLVRVGDNTDANDVVEVLMREFEARGTGNLDYMSSYYTVADAAEDVSKVIAIGFLLPEDIDDD